ncbi:MAG: hypothetical protein DMG13_32820, partial [Acidobacteria bacterium]
RTPHKPIVSEFVNRRRRKAHQEDRCSKHLRYRTGEFERHLCSKKSKQDIYANQNALGGHPKPANDYQLKTGQR